MKLYGQDAVFETLNKDIAVGDGMAKSSSDPYYFATGACALMQIRQALHGRKSDASIKRILDYACGYGRVMRWLLAAFPEAKIVGTDADPKAAASTAVTLNAETFPLDISLSGSLGPAYDLIWVGSLFTHLPHDETGRVISYLARHLNSGGMLVFTAHGRLVADRIESGDRNYNLSPDSCSHIVSEYKDSGYGFSDYPNMEGYGISISRPSSIMAILEAANLKPSYFSERGWVDHQDVYAAHLN